MESGTNCVEIWKEWRDWCGFVDNETYAANCEPTWRAYKAAFVESMSVLDTVQPEGECIELRAKGQESLDAECNKIWELWDLKCPELHDEKCSEVPRWV
jgi:hypothetical protein